MHVHRDLNRTDDARDTGQADSAESILPINFPSGPSSTIFSTR